MAKNDPEIRNKQQRLAEYLDRNDLDGVLLQTRCNFAWITGGRDNHVADNNPVGAAAILATRDGDRVCVTMSNFAERMRQEELAGTGIEVFDTPWYDRAAGAIKVIELMAGRRIAADADVYGMGLRELPPGFSAMRTTLTEPEVARYREGARLATAAMEHACRSLRFGTTEDEVAGQLDYHLRARGCSPVVTLVGADDRVTRVRQPVPSGKPVEHYVMLVTCAEYKGLFANLTRFVAFRPMVELDDRLRALADIDATVNLSTRPGRTLGEMFALIQRAYESHGYDGEWRRHHQGGSTGYRTREKVAFADSPVVIGPNQAFAWNPSIPGVKLEDTILCTAEGIEVLTAPSDDWPTIDGHFDGRSLARPNILTV
jgi:Xaa-Pro dipeptidase